MLLIIFYNSITCVLNSYFPICQVPIFHSCMQYDNTDLVHKLKVIVY